MKLQLSIIILFFLCIDVCGQNVALKADISSSSGESGCAVDNDFTTSWQATSAGEQWLLLDLKKPYFIHKVQQIFTVSSVWKFRIEASADNQEWITLVDNTKGLAGIVFGESVQGVYQYVKLTILGSADGFLPSSKEFSVVGSDAKNIAAGKAFIAIDRRKNYEPEKTTDGDISTYWCADDGRYPKSILLDLETSCKITGVQQIFKDYDRWRFKIEGSNDLTTWTILANKNGEWGCDFFVPVEADYRYVRLMIIGSSSGFWANSCEFRVWGAEPDPVSETTPSPNNDWWKNTSGLIRYYCKLYKNQLSYITDSLDILSSQGYQIIELMAPYKGDAAIWAGLGATDNYDIDPSIGTMADFEELLREAHARNMKVIFFGNVGYCSDQAPFFIKACRDECNHVDSKERKWFHFSDQKHNDQWFWSHEAQAYYYSYWGNTDGAAGRIPSYNFNNQEWREECRDYLKFWAEKGVDGLYLDAPEVYDGINDTIIQEYIVDVLNHYQISTNAEGSGDINRWIGGFGFNCVQGFDMYGWGGGKRSEVLAAMREGNPSGLNDKLKSYRDQATALNGVTLTPPMWEIKANVKERLFEASYLSTMGTLFSAHCGDKNYVAQDILALWPESDRNQFFNLMRTQNSYKGLAPSGQRTQLPTNNNEKFTAFKRSNWDGNVSALVIVNFQFTPQKITVNLKNSGIALQQTPVNLQDGTASTSITSEEYTVTLPAYGYATLGVENAYLMNNPSGINDIEEDKLVWSVYPNPFVNTLKITGSYPVKRIELYSLTGLLLKAKDNLPISGELDLSEVCQGTYMLKIQDAEGKMQIHKIIKQ